MACEYCFYRHNQGREGGGAGVVSGELLERFIAQYIQAQDNPTVFFAWQGGEPTLVGLDFYRTVVALQQKHARKGIGIANSFQTNGLLLDEGWCAFLAEHRFQVGISIDGPADIHDTYRRTRDGAPTFEPIRKAVDLLHKHKVRFDTLTTITPCNVHRMAEVYDFLTRELGSTTLQFQPCVERRDFESVAPGYWPAETVLPVGDPRTLPRRPDSILTDWSISAQEWGQFLCDLFDRWWQRDRETIVINWIHSWASQFAGGTAMMCICSPICGRAVSMEKDGRVYSCDHFVYPEYCLGQVSEGTSLSDLVRSARQRRFGEAKFLSLPAYCKRCPFLSVCYGECPKRRFLKTPDGEPGLNYLCPAYRVFFDHAGPRLAEFGRRFVSRRGV
jgi:uncharacterized protein